MKDLRLGLVNNQYKSGWKDNHFKIYIYINDIC